MTTETQTPEDWVLIEAAKQADMRDPDIEWLRSVFLHGSTFIDRGTFRALCYVIWKHEKPPVDRKLLCTQEALVGKIVLGPAAKDFENVCVRAIELWEEGFGDGLPFVPFHPKPKSETVTLPAGEYHNTTLSEDDTTPHVEVRKARYFNRYLTDAEVDEQVAQMRSEK
jgi:hypothetical protein